MGLIAYRPSTINTDALWPIAFGPPIYAYWQNTIRASLKFDLTFQIGMQLGIMAYGPNAINSNALLPTVFRSPIYDIDSIRASLHLGPHFKYVCCWA